MKKRILIVDDDLSFCEIMKFNLEKEGYLVSVANNGLDGLSKFKNAIFPVVITDLKMPKMDGLEFLKSVKKISNKTLVLVVTAFGNVETAVKSMKIGAFDFVPKPFNREHFKISVKKAFEFLELEEKVLDLQRELYGLNHNFIFKSKKMEELNNLITKIANSDISVLISGESGTGKEIIAKEIHKKSGRKNYPFVALNCAAIPSNLIESELFGHIKGAFSGAVKTRKGKFKIANKGTLFLDEIGDLPIEQQGKLLRVLQEKVFEPVGSEEKFSVDVRIIAATNKDLKKEVDLGNFREDLFFRLNVFPINIPPLRERVEDIEPLFTFFVKKYGKKEYVISKQLIESLKKYDWRGNVRELENVAQRILIFASTNILDETLLSNIFQDKVSNIFDKDLILPKDGFSLLDLEKKIIESALKINNYNKTKCANFLQIPRHILIYKLEKFNIKSAENE